MGAARFARLKSFVNGLGAESGLFWVTRLSNPHCEDPRYSQVIGLIRTIRSETALDIVTCETDDLGSKAGSSALLNVLEKFQAREKDGVLGPDYEYAILNGEILVNRIFPCSLSKQTSVSTSSGEAHVSITKPGRLNTLTWSTHASVPPQENEIEVEIYASGLNFRVHSAATVKEVLCPLY